jgi:hypothetical protein
VSLVLLSTRGLCSVSVLDGTSRATGWNVLPGYWGAVINLPSLSDSSHGPLASRVTYLSWDGVDCGFPSALIPSP